MTNPQIERALGYVRMSSQHRADSPSSLDNQAIRLSAHYRPRGTELIDIYRDDGLSIPTGNRPSFQTQVKHAVRSDDQYLLKRYHLKPMLAAIRIVAISEEMASDAERNLGRKTRRAL